jgi:hypothetical protein
VAGAGCSERPLAPQPKTPESVAPAAVDIEATARDIATRAGWSLDPNLTQEEGAVDSGPAALPQVLLTGRQTITGDIVHYSFHVRVGPGPYDEIGLHRVVRESGPHQPIRTARNTFLLHGDIKDFTGMFLPGVSSPRMPDDFGFAVFLAQNGIDVWGIDQAWTLVPSNVGDFSFMADWGMERNVSDLETGVELARTLRRMTGCGNARMILLGYSSGACTGFSYLGMEAMRPPGLRNVSAYIAGDYGLTTNDPIWQADNCNDTGNYRQLIETGNYALTNPFVLFGPPALSDPDGPSALIPGLTNLQAAMGLGAWTGYPDVTYHFVAGNFDESGIPVGLQYTNADMWIDFMVCAPPYEPYRFMLDYAIASCTPEDSPWVARLGGIGVPILYLEAAGGAGSYAQHTLDLVGSTDVTVQRVSLHSPEEILLDFAHVDLFIANNAPSLVWAPMLDWIVAHGPNGGARESASADNSGN